jgi:uncharacterized membrane protein
VTAACSHPDRRLDTWSNVSHPAVTWEGQAAPFVVTSAIRRNARRILREVKPPRYDLFAISRHAGRPNMAMSLRTRAVTAALSRARRLHTAYGRSYQAVRGLALPRAGNSLTKFPGL